MITQKGRGNPVVSGANRMAALSHVSTSVGRAWAAHHRRRIVRRIDRPQPARPGDLHRYTRELATGHHKKLDITNAANKVSPNYKYWIMINQLFIAVTADASWRPTRKLHQLAMQLEDMNPIGLIWAMLKWQLEAGGWRRDWHQPGQLVLPTCKTEAKNWSRCCRYDTETPKKKNSNDSEL